jgi:hypothetical protein
MIALSDRQLEAVMIAAQPLAIEKRACFLERIAGELARIRHPDDRDVDHAVRAALRGLMHAPAA